MFQQLVCRDFLWGPSPERLLILLQLQWNKCSDAGEVIYTSLMFCWLVACYHRATELVQNIKLNRPYYVHGFLWIFSFAWRCQPTREREVIRGLLTLSWLLRQIRISLLIYKKIAKSLMRYFNDLPLIAFTWLKLSSLVPHSLEPIRWQSLIYFVTVLLCKCQYEALIKPWHTPILHCGCCCFLNAQEFSDLQNKNTRPCYKQLSIPY